MLLYGFAVCQFVVPLLVMTEDNPILRTYNTQPFIIFRVLCKVNSRAVVPFDAKGGLRLLDRLWQAFTDISVEVER